MLGVVKADLGLMCRSKCGLKFNGGIDRPICGYRSVDDPHGIRLFVADRNRGYNSIRRFHCFAKKPSDFHRVKNDDIL